MMLRASEVAERLRVSRGWVYRHKDALAGYQPATGSALLFPENVIKSIEEGAYAISNEERQMACSEDNQGSTQDTRLPHKGGGKKWEAEQNETSWREPTTMVCLHEAATAYLDYSRERHHPSTYIGKRVALRRLFSHVASEALPDTVTANTALSMLMERRRETGNAAANKDRKHLAAFWEWGRKFYGWSGNPFKEVAKLPENCQPHYVPPVEDFWKVYAVADDTDRVMLLALLYTGGRRSEPFRWMWNEDIDLLERRIRLSTCKTADGSRKYEWLSMPRRLHEALVAHKLRMKAGTGHVFVSKKSGEPYHDRKHFITRLCDKAGVKRFNYHGIRGLCASLLAAGGVPMKDIQFILMHSSMTTTDRYIRRIGGTGDVLAAAFDRFEQTKMAAKVTPFAASK